MAPRPAHALLTLQVGSGTSATFCPDGGGCDLNPLADAVLYFVNLGGWSFSASTAGVAPSLGTPALPSLHFGSVYSSGFGAGSIYVAATEDGYTGPLLGNYLLSVGGLTMGTVSVEAFINSTLLGSLGLLTGAFSGTIGGPVYISGPYSLTIATTITHTEPGWSSLDTGLALPEPASLILLGSGLLVLGLVSGRRKSERELNGPLTSS